MKKLTKSILPKLKAVAYGTGAGGGTSKSAATPASKGNLHLFFPSYLSRADTTGPLKPEFLASLIECLVQDPKGSFSVWRELYMKNLPQSGTLLKHLVDNQVWNAYLFRCDFVTSTEVMHVSPSVPTYFELQKWLSIFDFNSVFHVCTFRILCSFSLHSDSFC